MTTFCGILLLLALAEAGIRFEQECSSAKPVVRDLSSQSILPISSDNDRFQVIVNDPGYVQGEQKLVSISPDNSGIVGFVLSAYDHNENLIGQWSARDGDSSQFRVVGCDSRPGGNVFVSEKWPAHKMPIAVWTASPNSVPGPITIRATVATASGAYFARPIRLQPRSNKLLAVSLEECGSSKGCYLVPANCKARDCLYMLTWATVGDSVHYELSARTDGWVGVGFSEDNHIGNDQMVICAQAPSRSNVANHARMMNTFLKDGNRIPELISAEEPLLGIDTSRISAAYSRDHITCSFSRTKSPPQGYGYKIKDLNKPHYLLASYGSSAEMVDGMPSLVNPPHITDRRVDFNKEAVDSRYRSSLTGSWLAKVHASLMIVAWVFLASVAMLTSRYYRPMWITATTSAGVERQRKYFWVSVYQPLILSVAVLSVIGLVFILFELNWTWPTMPRQLWHSALGMTVIILSLLNVALSFCVPRYNGRGYCLWFWCHWIVSSLAHCIAIPIIFLGMDQPRLDLWDWCSWLLLAWCIFHILTDLILEIHYCMTYRKSYERFEEIPSSDQHYRQKSGWRNSRSGSWRNSDGSLEPRRSPPPGYKWKPFCLGLYVIVTLAVVLTLIIAIILYD